MLPRSLMFSLTANRTNRFDKFVVFMCKSSSYSSTSPKKTNIVKRSNKYAVLNETDLKHFENLLESSGCLTSEQDVKAFNTDWVKISKGHSKLVLLPKNTQQVSEILKYCNERSLAVCPQGGNTGLVGGSVPLHDEIVVSTNRMNRIWNVDIDSSVLTCQSGCILQTVEEHLNTHGLTFPLDLGAKGSCQLGGNLSTNAGGLRLLRYGSLRGNVLGLEVVLADGRILDLMNVKMRKDNTGYDLKQLFIGAEGTLGIITNLSIVCPVKPRSTNVALVACSGTQFDSVLGLFRTAKQHLNEILSAFEFMDAETMRAVTDNLDLVNPFSRSGAAFYCLIETRGSNENHDRVKIESLFETLTSEGLCTDAILAENQTQMTSLWNLRERIAEACRKDGYQYKYDLSLPLTSMYDLVIDLRKRLSMSSSHLNLTRCIGYGHLGDSNLHINLTSSQYDAQLHSLIEPFVYDWTREKHGSVSAEHGLGARKRHYIYHSKTSEAVGLMKMFKNMFDPKGILNPYKTLPDD